MGGIKGFLGLEDDSAEKARQEDERRRKEREARISRDRAKIFATFGITDTNAYDQFQPDFIIKNRDWLRSQGDGVLNPQTMNELRDSRRIWNANDYRALAEANRKARDEELGNRRQSVMDYFSDEINRRRDDALRNIRLTAARRGISIAPLMGDLTEELTRGQARASSNADDIIAAIRNADRETANRLADALYTSDAGADIQGAKSAFESNLDKISSMQKQYNFSDLFERINSIYGQQGALDAYNQGRRYARRRSSENDAYEKPIMTQY